MRTIGLIGGMSWESTVTYYQVINHVVQERLGGLHSAQCLLYSVNFAEIAACQSRGAWDESGAMLADAARALERGGADCCVICTNTMHKVADQVQAAVSIPLLHIAEMTAQVLREQGISEVGLLGTQYTMEQTFYSSVLESFGIAVRIPTPEDRVLVNDIIFHELCLGNQLPQSKAALLRIIEALAEQGAQGVVLGCTELGMLIKQPDTPIPLFDTAQIHARKVALWALGEA